MGFGTEIPLLLGLGLVVLGPKRMHGMLGRVARAKTEFDKMSRGFKSHLAAETKGAPRTGKNDDRPGSSAVADRSPSAIRALGWRWIKEGSQDSCK
jgi:Sec-independent protein translocase protein TatA